MHGKFWHVLEDVGDMGEQGGLVEARDEPETLFLDSAALGKSLIPLALFLQLRNDVPL